jgi:site-specific DNA-methyltransferase (adenine-specific)
MAEAYYSDDLVTLWHGDCREITAWLDADVLVTDPPYGIDYRTNAQRQTLARSIEGDRDTSARDDALSLWRDGWGDEALQRPALMFGTWRIPRPLCTRQVLVWDTKGALGMGATDLPWKPGHQEVYVLGKGFTGHRGNDVLTCAPVQSLGYNGREHPHEKPVDLMAGLIRKCPAGMVADPFAGSGATLIAAKREGRRAVGVELDERYCEITAKRLAASQDTLFGGVA